MEIILIIVMSSIDVVPELQDPTAFVPTIRNSHSYPSLLLLFVGPPVVTTTTTSSRINNSRFVH